MSIILKAIHIFDNNKKREYVSQAGTFLSEYDKKFPTQSASQIEEVKKHRNIFSRKNTDFIL